jgi:hypothetical protein
VGVATLGGVPFRIDPDSVSWSFKMKVADRPTVGGKVVQVLGTSLGDMTVTGRFGNGDRALGDVEGWQEQARFLAQVKAWVQEALDSSGARTLRFVYPPRRWDFRVLIKAYNAPDGGPAVRHDQADFNPGWQLVLFIVEDVAGRVVSGIQDLYIQRLMAGIGWRQSAYNGPTQEQVDATLEPYGGDLSAYLAEQFNQAAGYHRGDTAAPAADPAGSSSGTGDGWITQAGQALGRSFTADEREGLKIIALHESTNDPKARNDTAAGRAAGGPKGLMQVVDGTFAANALPGHGDVFNPVDNIIAAVRYILGRYGSIANVPGVKSVRAGQPYRPY